MLLTSIFNLIKGVDPYNEPNYEFYFNSNFQQIHNNAIEIKLQWKGLKRIFVFENHSCFGDIFTTGTHKSNITGKQNS